MTTIAEKLGLTVGGPAYYEDAYNRVAVGTVLRITPSGQVVIKLPNGKDGYEVRCDSNGRQMRSGSVWRYGELISEEDYQRRQKHQKRKNQERNLQQELHTLANSVVTYDELPMKLEAFAKKLRAWQLEA